MNIPHANEVQRIIELDLSLTTTGHPLTTACHGQFGDTSGSDEADANQHQARPMARALSLESKSPQMFDFY
jgi:hypothetical protein